MIRVANWTLPATAAAAVALAVLAGCSASSPYMQPGTAAASLRPPPGKALVIFVRPSSVAPSIKFTLLTSEGAFLGDSLPSSHFAAALPPGRHTFLIWAENTAAMQADLAADRTYYVEVAVKMGAASARGHLLTIAPRNERWGKVGAWLQTTRRLRSNFAAGQAYLDARAADKVERIRRASERWRKYDPSERSERTIYGGDGVANRPGRRAVARARSPRPARSSQPAVRSAPPRPMAATAGRLCTKDTDCPNDEICSGGVCAAPAARHRAPPAKSARAAPAKSAPAKAALANSVCAADKQCPGKKHCQQGQCVEVDEMSFAEYRRRVTARRKAMAEEKRRAANAAQKAKLEARRREVQEKRRLAEASRKRAEQARLRKRREARSRAEKGAAAARLAADLSAALCLRGQVFRDGACKRKADARGPQPAPAATGPACKYRDLASCTASCKARHPKSCYNLASMYYFGKGVRKDQAKARAHYTAGCRDGSIESCVNLAYMCEAAMGGKKNLPLAVALYEQTCNRGAKRSCFKAGVYYREGLTVNQDEKRARSIFSADCKGGGKRSERLSCSALGDMMRRGVGGPKDLAGAQKMFSKACAAGPEGCAELGWMLCRGEGVVKNPGQCRKYLKKACAGGYKSACGEGGQQ